MEHLKEKLKGKSQYISLAIIIILVIIIITLVVNKEGDNAGITSNDSTRITSKDNLSTEIISKKEDESNIEKDDEGKEITLEDKITIDNFCEFSVNKSIISKNINPTNPSSYYQYLKSSDGKILVGLELKLKSLKNTAVQQNSMISGKIIYDNNYEYICTVSTENANGSDIETYTNLYNIEPLETLKYFLISEVSQEIVDSGKPIKAIINVNGNSYSFNIK